MSSYDLQNFNQETNQRNENGGNFEGKGIDWCVDSLIF